MPKSKRKAKFPNIKISENFLRFAEPLLDARGPQPTEEDLETALQVAFVVWNAVVYEDVGVSTEIIEKTRNTASHNPNLAVLIDQLIARKRCLFRNDQRLIGEFKLFFKDGELRLRAEGRNPLSNLDDQN